MGAFKGSKINVCSVSRNFSLMLTQPVNSLKLHLEIPSSLAERYCSSIFFSLLRVAVGTVPAEVAPVLTPSPPPCQGNYSPLHTGRWGRETFSDLEIRSLFSPSQEDGEDQLLRLQYIPVIKFSGRVQQSFEITGISELHQEHNRRFMLFCGKNGF